MVLGLFISRMFSWITTFVIYSLCFFSLVTLLSCNRSLSSMPVTFPQILIFLNFFIFHYLLISPKALSLFINFCIFFWLRLYISNYCFLKFFPVLSTHFWDFFSYSDFPLCLSSSIIYEFISSCCGIVYSFAIFVCISFWKAFLVQRDVTVPYLLSYNNLVWNLTSILLCCLFLCEITLP